MKQSIIILSILFPLLLSAQFKVAAPFSDHMVLQRNKPIVIWGTGEANKVVLGSVGDEKKETIVTANGHWRIQFSPRSLSEKPIEIKMQVGEEVKYFRDVLIGDLWLCIGQSNMEWPMRNEKHWSSFRIDESHSLIRFANPPPAGRNVFNQSFNDSLLKRLSPESFYKWNGWELSSTTSLTNMSAVAFYFADAVTKRIKIPTGLINLSIGGAPLETFVDTKALKNDSIFVKKVSGDWRYNTALPEWIRVRGRQNLDTTVPLYKDEFGPDHAFKPGVAFANGIHPLKDLAIAGVLVYQGESNAEEANSVAEYGDLFTLMVDSYRDLWKDDRLPIYWVQLSSIRREHWPRFRDEQRKLLETINHSGMAVTTDIGHPTDVHPRDKKTVGERLARWALHDVYGKKIEVSGPLPTKAMYKRGKIVVFFKHAKHLRTSDGQLLREFSVDGKNELKAQIHKNKVVIFTNKTPEYIYYGWVPYSKGNLVNEAGLPTSTFKLKVQ